MSSTDDEPKNESKPKAAPAPAPAPAAPADPGQQHPVDVGAQEEAAQERAEGGGYN